MALIILTILFLCSTVSILMAGANTSTEKSYSQVWGIGIETPGPRFKTKTSYQYRKSHCGDKTILRPSYLQGPDCIS